MCKIKKKMDVKTVKEFYIEENSVKNGKMKSKCGPFLKIRYIQVALLFFMLFIQFSNRMCFTVAIVAMTTHNTSSNSNVPAYDWKNTSIMLSSFYWSYVILQFFVGNLLQKVGIKWLLLSSVFVSSVGSILIPVTAEYFGSNGVIFCRVLQGLFQGLILPLISSVLGRWIPPKELSLAHSIIFLGISSGIISSLILTGYFSASSWGWPAAFYTEGIGGLIWCIFWLIFFADTPALHKSISPEERKHIELSLDQQNDHLITKRSVPWKAIFKSLPYWAIIVAAIGESWGTTYINSELPNYFSNAVGLDITDSSLFSSAPTTGSLVAGLIYGPIANYTISKGHISRVNSRRFFHGLGAFSLAACLVFVPYIENKLALLILMVVSHGLSHGLSLGHLINPVDLSPRYAGVLSGMANGCGQLVAICAPILVQFIVTDETNKALWRIMFIVASIICASTGIFFIICCSGERQWWDSVDQDKLRIENKDLPLPKEGETNKIIVKDC